MQDDQLLTQYARTGSDAAFSQLVARHLPLVYRTCRRELGSDTLAEDAAQVVFLLLARKAKTLRAGPSLVGWLFQTARFVASDVRKQELRRKRREEAVMQEAIHQQTTPVSDWNTVELLLNPALAKLKPAVRDAVLLRFFEGHTLAETGTLLGLSEDAARMRCARAVEKLRRYLTAQGAAVTSLALTGFLAAEAAHPVPAHAAATITQGTLQAISTGPIANVLLLLKGVSHTMKLVKIKYAALAAVTLLIGASVPPLVHAFIPQKLGAQTVAAPSLSAEASTQATGTQAAPTFPAAETQRIVLQHTVAGEIVKFLHWDQAAKLPAGVTKIEAVPAQNALAVTATPTGFAKVREILKPLDVEPRQVLIQTAFANVTEADLAASGVNFSLVPLDKPRAGSAPVLVRYASSNPAAKLLQTLTKQSVVNQAPDITTTNNVSAFVNLSTKLPSGQTESTEVSVTPRINTDNSVALALRLALSNDTVKCEVSTLRTIKNGDTVVLIMPPAGVQVAGLNLVLFVTSTFK